MGREELLTRNVDFSVDVVLHAGEQAALIGLRLGHDRLGRLADHGLFEHVRLRSIVTLWRRQSITM